MSSFFGLNIGRSGLMTSQKSLNTVGHNISNVNTPGYTRQRVEQRATMPISLAGGTGMQGTGSEGFKVVQIRNEFLDTKYRNESTPLGEWYNRTNSLSELEAVFNEPGNTGIRKTLDEFFNSLSELEKGPASLTTRAVVREKSKNLAETLNHMQKQMDNMIRDADYSARTTAEQINSIAKDIASLNNQIFSLESDSSNANDLRDQRNLLLDELSSLVNIQVIDEDSAGLGNSKMKILVDGHPLVDHNSYDQINVSTKKPHKYGSEIGYEDDVTVFKWSAGSELNMDGLSGQLKSYVDMRDNNEIDGKKGFPYYMNKLNEFTSTFVREMNNIQATGYGLDAKSGYLLFGDKDKLNLTNAAPNYTMGNPAVAKTVEDILKDPSLITEWEKKNPGKTLYSISDSNNGTVKYYEGDKITAKNIKVCDDILKDLDAIAAGSSPNLPEDKTNLEKLINLRHKDDMFDWGSPEDFVKSLISNLGVEAGEAKRMATNQAVLVDQIDNMRQSTSGVSLDEEMGNMIKFQHAYNASARVITTVDEMIDVVINRMGKVGL